MEISENIYSDVHRLLLCKNADGENERIEIYLLGTNQATFHLHVSMNAEEKKNIQLRFAYAKTGANAAGL